MDCQGEERGREGGVVINRGLGEEGDKAVDCMDKEGEVVEVTFPLEGGGVVRVVVGLWDRLHLAFDDPEATYLGRP